MTPPPAWFPLPVPSIPGLPVLLVSIEINTAAYTIHLTDMANMWVESLDRKAICIRGWSENTSIDPSDTPENMTKFLTSLKTALDSSQPGHDATSLDLVPASESDAGKDGLTLKITCDLSGLQPLKWPMHLKKSPQSSIATDLVLPLIQAHFTRSREVQSLLHLLSQKDAILTKLLDKLEAQGTGLEHIFNPLSGKKKVNRAAAGDKIPGLAPFSPQHWKAGLRDDVEGPNNTDALVKHVFGGEGLFYQPLLETDTSPELDKWWHDFTGIPRSILRAQKNSVAIEETPSTMPQNQPVSKDDDEEFQVQKTPPHLKPSRQDAKQRTEILPDDASTDDDKSPEQVKSSPKLRKPASRLGALGGRKKLASPRSPSPQPKSPKEHVPDTKVDDSETASESDGDSVTAPQPAKEDSPPAPSRVQPPAKKGGLGRIGGPKAIHPKQSSTLGLLDATYEAEPPLKHTATKKLGMIGGKAGTSESTKRILDEDGSRGRPRPRDNDQAMQESAPRETSQERADRKREELKRELEKKAAAGPAKKKRKF